ncbi:MAG: single-stranded-DNA-specific exonuclease RecJ [Eubacteriales bacterium]|nr:single-stranded-DNA-specific exonuclease RecJ [Eubacteriales bacterium]
MKEKWVVSMKKASFQKLGDIFHLDPVLIRLMRNREVFTEEDEKTVGENGRTLAENKIEKFLYGGLQDLYDPERMKDLPRAAEILREAIETGKRIRIIGDYDIDGIMSTYILLRGLRLLGADVDYCIPERIRDGYGLNENLVRRAKEDGRELLLTCDNGISAAKQIELAGELGLTTIVTDHHQVPYEEVDGEIRYILPPAAAVVDPHRADCSYPFEGLCGAGVAFKLICHLYDLFRIKHAQEEKEELLEFAAFATIGDVMELKDENRILVREGLRRLRRTKNPGMQELIRQNNLEMDQIDTYHIGFVLGPCLNASGRLDTASRALEMLLSDSRERAAALAGELIALNASRKEMTLEGTEQAIRLVENSELLEDRVLVVYLPDCHESLAGIIAGRLKEHFHRPSFVLTRTEEGVKGSGRSIENYSMYEELLKCKELLTKFGGHPMAAGISLPEENVDIFRRKLNSMCTLTENDMIPKLKIDIPMPVSYIHEGLIKQMELLKPFGNGNEKPLFAERQLHASAPRIMGKNRNAAKTMLSSGNGCSIEGLYFGDAEGFAAYLEEHSEITCAYFPTINEWRGRITLQVNITSYQ